MSATPTQERRQLADAVDLAEVSAQPRSAASRGAPADERSFRGQGCTEACKDVRAILPGRFGRSDLLLHDPQTHEAYGRATAVGVLAGDPIVWTGTLVIDRWARTVASFGHDVAVTGREWQILDFLAARLGRFTLSREVALAVWDSDWYGSHLLRVNISRLRRRLGANAALLETSPGRGYRLAALPPVEAQPEDEPRAAAGPWALAYACCACCGRTDRAHSAHGRCRVVQLEERRARAHGAMRGARSIRRGDRAMTENATRATSEPRALAVIDQEAADTALDHILATGDLAQLTARQRVGHYLNQCRSHGLNPISRPFDWLILDDRLVLYANKSCAEQLGRAHQISIKILRKEVAGDLFVCEVEGRMPDGVTNQASKYVPLTARRRDGTTYRLAGKDLANAFAKAETGAKRRLVLSMVGLSSPPDPDEAPRARFVTVDAHGNVLDNPTREQKYLAETPTAARVIGEPTFETTASPEDDPLAEAATSQAPRPEELEQPARQAARPTFKRSDDDSARLRGAWFASVKETSLDDDDARHKFIRQWTALHWPQAKQTESVRTFFARATDAEAADLLAHVRALADDERRAAAEQQPAEEPF